MKFVIVSWVSELFMFNGCGCVFSRLQYLHPTRVVHGTMPRNILR